MKTAYILSGHVTPQGTLELDERVPLAPGPVRVSVEEASDSTSLPRQAPLPLSDEQELRRRKAHMDTLAGCISDEEAKKILDSIEQEFEQVNPDEWR
jgi:hypothetical protein